MADLFQILPMAILYLASGYSFICGFYLLIDRRFDFMSDISFSVMLVLGFLLDSIARAVPFNFGFTNMYCRNLLLVGLSFICGIVVALLRNIVGDRINNFVIRHGRRKSSSEIFWYDILDSKERPVWIRLLNGEKKYYLDGVLLSLSETKENPYLLLCIANRGTYNTTITSTNGITLPAGYYAGGTIKVSDNFAFVGSNFTCNFGSGEVATAFKDTDTLIPFPSISSQTSNLISVTGTQINALAAIPTSQLTITISVRHTDEVMGGTPNVTLKAYKSGSLISTLDLATGMYSAWVTHTITINIPAMSKGQYVYLLFSYEGKETQAQIKSAKLTWTN